MKTETNHRIEEIVVGKVTKVDDKERLGRVKVQYSTRTVDVESDWAPVVAPMTGGNRGTYFPFEVGDSVLIALAGGDIYTPYVLGGLWNREAPPPIETDEEQTDLRIIRSRSGHELRFEDTPSGERTELRSSGGHNILLDDPSGTVTVETDGGASRLQIDADGNVVVEGETLRLTGATIELDASRSVTINGTQSVNVTGTNINIK